MVVVLLAAWVLGGLLLALVVGGAVRIADQRAGRPGEPVVHEVETPAAA